jgi:hypothetical protein
MKSTAGKIGKDRAQPFAPARLRTSLLLTGLSCGLVLGCAHQRTVSNQLAEARAVYARASAGPARRYAPARLAEATQALRAAEQAHLNASPSEAEDRAYVAARRSELAEAEASTRVAIERRSLALQELAGLTGVHADRARAELAAAKQKSGSPELRTDLVSGIAGAPAQEPSTLAGRGPETLAPAAAAQPSQLQPARMQQQPQSPPPSPPAANAGMGLTPARATETVPVSSTPPTIKDNGGDRSPHDLVPPPVGPPATPR